MQTYKEPVGPIVAAQNIYKNYGIIGFYSGFIPNTVRVALKQFYRFPLMIFLPSFVKKQYKNIFKSDIPSSLAKSTTGFIIAFS